VNQGRNNRERIPQTFEAFGFAVLKYLQVSDALFSLKSAKGFRIFCLVEGALFCDFSTNRNSTRICQP
jgi:hypothetical protein